MSTRGGEGGKKAKVREGGGTIPQHGNALEGGGRTSWSLDKREKWHQEAKLSGCHIIAYVSRQVHRVALGLRHVDQVVHFRVLAVAGCQRNGFEMRIMRRLMSMMTIVAMRTMMTMRTRPTTSPSFASLFLKAGFPYPTMQL